MINKSRPLSIFLFAGEPSGDLHGSHLLHALKNEFSESHFWGVGGPEMRKEGLTSFLKMEDFAVMGFTDVLRCLPRLWRQFHAVKKSVLAQRPDVVILIDYPGFNLRLAQHLRKGGYQGKIVQYISPSIWAHGKKRIEQMAKTLDLLITIYPFEFAYFKNTDLKVFFAGNPLQEYLSKHVYHLKEAGLPTSNQLISIFPGSRKQEIQRNFPLLLRSAELIKSLVPDAVFGISYSDENLKQLIEEHLHTSPLTDVFLIPKTYTYELMRKSRSSLAKSGTVTLELALHKIPTVVVYRLSFINRFIAKFWLGLKLPCYALPNILGDKEIFPEFIDKPATPEQIAQALVILHIDSASRRQCLSECDEISKSLGQGNASKNAAREIANLIV